MFLTVVAGFDYFNVSLVVVVVFFYLDDSEWFSAVRTLRCVWYHTFFFSPYTLFKILQARQKSRR